MLCKLLAAVSPQSPTVTLMALNRSKHCRYA